PSIGEAKARRVALDQEGVFDLEYTALKMLTEAEKRQREKGVMLWLVGLTPRVRAMVQHSPLGAALGRERMFFNLEQAVARHQAASGPGATPWAPSPGNGKWVAFVPLTCYFFPARRRSAGALSRTCLDRWTARGSEDSHRDPRRWLRRGLHRPPPGAALQAAAGCRDRPGEPGQLPLGHAA